MAPRLSLLAYYPRATGNRLAFNDPVLVRARRSFIKGSVTNFLLLQLLFLGLFSYIFGALFQQTSHTHNLTIAFVDYDAPTNGSGNGAVGRAVLAAYDGLRRDGFPTLVPRDPAEFPVAPEDLREAVCHVRYWGALYVSPGASQRLSQALQGGSAAESYDPADVMTYVWNEAVYPPTVDGAIAGSLQTLSAAAKVAYLRGGNGTGGLQSVSGAAALSVAANPWTLREIDIQPTTQGSRAIYNSLVVVLILIQEFFYLGTINGLHAAHKIYARVNAHRIVVVRTINSGAYTLVGSLCTAGAIWAFRSGWDVDGGQFALTWMAIWLFAHANFMALDVFTIWLPPPFVPMALVSWIVFNVTSVLLPLALSAKFYRVGHAAPAHNLYQVLTDIWSGGCNPRLHQALPILFAWEVLTLALSAIGVYRRAHNAAVAEEAQARQFAERVDAAVAFEMEKIRGVRADDEKKRRRLSRSPEGEGPAPGREGRAPSDAEAAPAVAASASSSSSSSPEEADEAAERAEEASVRRQLSRIVSRMNSSDRRERRRESQAGGFGPSFPLPFVHRDGGGSDEDDER